MEIVVESVTEEARIGTRCACGGCHPTATVYRDDPAYERHSPKLAQAPSHPAISLDIKELASQLHYPFHQEGRFLVTSFRRFSGVSLCL